MCTAEGRQMELSGSDSDSDSDEAPASSSGQAAGPRASLKGEATTNALAYAASLSTLLTRQRATATRAESRSAAGQEEELPQRQHVHIITPVEAEYWCGRARYLFDTRLAPAGQCMLQDCWNKGVLLNGGADAPLMYVSMSSNTAMRYGDWELCPYGGEYFSSLIDRAKRRGVPKHAAYKSIRASMARRCVTMEVLIDGLRPWQAAFVESALQSLVRLHLPQLEGNDLIGIACKGSGPEGPPTAGVAVSHLWADWLRDVDLRPRQQRNAYKSRTQRPMAPASTQRPMAPASAPAGQQARPFVLQLDPRAPASAPAGQQPSAPAGQQARPFVLQLDPRAPAGQQPRPFAAPLHA